jgi:hypothetical protein
MVQQCAGAYATWVTAQYQQTAATAPRLSKDEFVAFIRQCNEQWARRGNRA